MASENEAPDRGGLTLLSPYLIPYFTSAKMDDEAENIWRTYIPEALEDPELRKAHALAKAMGLSIKYVPLHEHQGISSVLFLIDDFVIATENKESPEKVCIPANTIVINTNAIKKEYSWCFAAWSAAAGLQEVFPFAPCCFHRPSCLIDSTCRGQYPFGFPHFFQRIIDFFSRRFRAFPQQTLSSG